MLTRDASRDHISAAVPDAAAIVVSVAGPAASMEDIAAAAGIGRATLYRYFPSRDELLRTLANAALDEVHRSLCEAELDRVPVPEALARIARALVTCGSKYAFLVNERSHVDTCRREQLVGVPIRAVVERGQRDGSLRRDIPANLLVELLGGLLWSAVQLSGGGAGVEGVSAVMTSLFLDGASRTATADHPVTLRPETPGR